MTDRNDSNRLNWPRWQKVLLIAVLVLFIGNRLTSLVDAAAHRAGWFGEGALIEVSWVRDPNAPAGFRKVDRVEPNSSVARAGVRIGDHVRVESRFRDGRQIARGERPYRQDWLFAGDRINFTLDRGGIRSEFHVILQPISADHEQEYRNSLRIVNVLAAIISSLIGCFVLWRGWGNTTAMLLGAALTFIGRGWSTIPP